MLRLLAGAAVLTAGLIAAVWIGSRREGRERSAHVERLMRSAATARAPSGFEELDALPPPVTRYLRRALPERRAIRVVRMRQAGRLRTDVRSERWMPFEAEHTAAPQAIGFVWNARVQVAPLMHVAVRDAYVTGEGLGHVSLLSALPVSAARGTPEMNSGSLHRFLAEAVWYPTALLPGPNLRWTALDAGRALATLTDHGVSVSLEFRFTETGEVSGIYTPSRWGTFDGGYEQRPWEGHFHDYRMRDGVLVPTSGDVGWYAGDRWQAVWEGTISAYEAPAEREDSGR